MNIIKNGIVQWISFCFVVAFPYSEPDPPFFDVE